MAYTSTFHLFPRLPYELRRQIYLLATPQRVVHVQERFPGFPNYKAAYDDFEECHKYDKMCQEADVEYRSMSVRCSSHPEIQEAKDEESELYFEPKWVTDGIHPDIAYFAHFWRQYEFRGADARIGSHVRVARRLGRLPPFPGALMSSAPPPYISESRVHDPDFDEAHKLYGVEPGTPRTAVTQELLKQDEADFLGLPEQLRPWTPSPDVPEFPLHWLYNRARHAWQFQRQSELFSRAPIPSFLHVCGESREALKEAGYQLAFGSRLTDKRSKGEEDGEHGGMTWFNFAQDTLYIGHVEHDYPVDEFLTEENQGQEWLETNRAYPMHVGGNLPWDVSVFLARDLKRVTRLALPQSSSFVRCIGFDPKMHVQLVNLLRCFPALDELLMADWAHLKGEGGTIPEYETTDYDEDRERREAVRRHRLSKAGEAWYYVRMQDIDVFSPRVLKKWQGDFWTAVGEGIRGVMAFWALNKGSDVSYAGGNIGDGLRKEDYSNDSALPRDWFQRMARELQIDFATIAREAPDAGLAPLGMKSFPKVSLVHIGTVQMLEALRRERSQVWQSVLHDKAQDTGEHVSSVDGRSLLPHRWDSDNGWTLDRICPFEDERYEWSIVEKGLQKKSDPIEHIPRRTKTWQ